MYPKRKIKTADVPFYELPGRRKSSAEIIRAAKAEVQLLSAKRPSTPCLRNTSDNDNLNIDSRPLSSISHISFCSDSSQNRPLSSIRLQPLRAKSAGHHELIDTLHLEPTAVKAKLVKRSHWRQKIPVHHGGSDTVSSDPYVGKTQLIKGKEHPQKHDLSLDSSEINFSTETEYVAHSNADPCDSDDIQSISDSDESHIRQKSIKIDNLVIGVECESVMDDKESQPEEFENEVNRYFILLNKVLSSGKARNELSGLETISKLYEFLKDTEMLKTPFEQRFELLKILFRLINFHFPTLSLHVAKLILEMGVAEKNLIQVFKLLYKICHEEKNIVEFLSCNILEPFLKSVQKLHPSKNFEAIRYSISLICLLAAKDLLIDVLSDFECHWILLRHFEIINSCEEFNKNDESSHVLIKIITALRYLSENNDVWKVITENEIVNELMKILKQHEKNVQVVITTIRLLSKLADSSEGCEAIFFSSNSSATFCQILEQHKSQPFILLQVVFIIGSLIAHRNSAALNFYTFPGFLSILHDLLDKFTKEKVEASEWKDSFTINPLFYAGGSGDQKGECDLLLKIIRVYANMCICDSAGYMLAKDGEFVFQLLRLINLYKIENEDENFLNATICSLSALNNITYFVEPESTNFALYISVFETIFPLLSETYPKVIRIESCNIVRNLTRLSSIRSFIYRNKLIPAFVSLLDQSENDIAFNGCSIILNLLVDKDAKVPFYNEQGICKLLNKLHKCVCRDWSTSALICQMFWNFCAIEDEEDDTEDNKKPLTDQELNHLVKVLGYTTSRGAVLEIDGEDAETLWREEFNPIAKKLLALLETFT